MDTFELRLFVKSYLDDIKVKVRKFSNNLPGKDWTQSFLARHRQTLAHRLVPNVKRSRGEVFCLKIVIAIDKEHLWCLLHIKYEIVHISKCLNQNFKE